MTVVMKGELTEMGSSQNTSAGGGRGEEIVKLTLIAGPRIVVYFIHEASPTLSEDFQLQIRLCMFYMPKTHLVFYSMFENIDKLHDTWIKWCFERLCASSPRSGTLFMYSMVNSILIGRNN